ncbi:hypothetical protein SLS62_009951 [Diatrype stigma]|uniref:FAD-binding domain-containing protein n=1 Tax=Diatrype stigma TaxID=117547 RepID=A0AAN9UEI5_9PEZI
MATTAAAATPSPAPPSPPPPLKVLIVGGGIAGPALAYWLSQLAVPGVTTSITLVERSSAMRATGQQVDLRAQGIPLMRKMGIEAAVRASRVREPGTQLVDTHGRIKAFFPAVESPADGSGQNKDPRQGVTSEYEIMRGDLVRILYGLTAGRANVAHLYGETVESLVQEQGQVRARFGSDGRSELFDLVVGADGTGSRTRRLMLGPDAPDPRHRLGGYIAYYSVAPATHDSDRFTGCLLPGPTPRIIGTRKDCAELTRVYMIAPAADDDPAVDAAYRANDSTNRNLAQLRTAWADLYEGGGWECGRFVEALRHAPEADDFYCTPFEEVRLPEGDWSRGQIVLLGDAAHCKTAGGIGCTWALVGAYVLAGEIATLLAAQQQTSLPPPPPSSLDYAEAVEQGAQNYERVFRPIATAHHSNGSPWAKLKSLMIPSSAWGIWALQLVMGVVAYFHIDQATSVDDETVDWQLPDYPALGGGEGGERLQARS